jgi:hypothetical protein
MKHPLVTVAELALEMEPIAYQGVRKIINGMTWGPIRLPNQMKFSDLGYGPNKEKQLMRNYVNEEEFERVRAVLERRKTKGFTSVAISMRGKPKDARSMGHCILSVVITRTKGTERIEVQYRSTELTLKFGGDLCFLPRVLERVGVDLSSPVTFRFANCYLSGVYLPYLVTFVDDPVDFLHKKVWKKDPQFAASATRFFLRSAMRENQFFPYSPENVAHRFGWERIPRKTMEKIRDYLADRHGELGSLDWAKVHHKKGDYIPRGKRGGEEDE